MFRNQQRLCPREIDGDFLDEKLDDKKTWVEETVWCIPPVEKESIIDCYNKCISRNLNGYIVIGTGYCSNSSVDNIWKLSQQRFYSLIQEKSMYCIDVPAQFSQNVSNRWHSQIFYFDFRS